MSNEKTEKTNTGLLQYRTNFDEIGDAEDTYNFAEGFFETDLDHEAPIPVCDCIAYLRANAMDHQGIFRTPGNLQRVKEIIKRYNKYYKKKVLKRDPNYSVLNEFPEEVKPNDVASLLKKFFNDLNEPLIPEKYKGVMFFIMKAKMSEEEKQKELMDVLSQVPSPNKEVAGYLLSFLRELSVHEEETKMDAKNLGMCLAVCFFRGKNSGEQIMLSTFGTLILQAFIESKIELPMPKKLLVDKNTLYDEFYVPPEPVKRGSMFGSFRNSFMGMLGSSTNVSNKPIRSVLEDVQLPSEIEAEAESAKKKARNSKDNESGAVKNIKDSSSVGSEANNTQVNENSSGKKQQKMRGRANSFNKMSIEIFGVKESDTLAELREKNKGGIVLPPDDSAMTKKQRKKAKKRYKTGRKGSMAASASAMSSAVSSPPSVTPTIIKSKSDRSKLSALSATSEKHEKTAPAMIKSKSDRSKLSALSATSDNNEVSGREAQERTSLKERKETKLSEVEDEDTILSRLNLSPSAGHTTRESLKGMRFSAVDAEEARKVQKERKRKKRSVSRGHSKTNLQELEKNKKRSLPPVPARKRTEKSLGSLEQKTVAPVETLPEPPLEPVTENFVKTADLEHLPVPTESLSEEKQKDETKKEVVEKVEDIEYDIPPPPPVTGRDSIDEEI